MATANMKQHKLGWIGIGRMGYAMAQRLAQAGCDIAVWNRTQSKAEPLKTYGAKVVATLPDLPLQLILAAGTLASFSWLLVQDQIHPLFVYFLQVYLTF